MHVSGSLKLLADIVAMTTQVLANRSRNSGTLVARASTARSPGNGDKTISCECGEKYEIHPNEHWPHHSLGQAAPLKPLPDTVIDLDAEPGAADVIGGAIHEYELNTRRNAS